MSRRSGWGSRSSGGRRVATSPSNIAGRRLKRILVQQFAKELVALQPDLILTQNTPITAAVLQQTRTIPIIFANVSDPVGSGFVAGLPRPGGNVTGLIDIDASMAGKWLGLLKEIAPRVARVAFLFNPATAPFAEYYVTPPKPPLRPSQ